MVGFDKVRGKAARWESGRAGKTYDERNVKNERRYSNFREDEDGICGGRGNRESVRVGTPSKVSDAEEETACCRGNSMKCATRSRRSRKRCDAREAVEVDVKIL